MSERLAAQPDEIAKLLEIADRELADAAVPGLSADGQFEHAYGATLQLATAAIRKDGQRIHGPEHHRRTFEIFATLGGGRWADLADYLQHCRRRRNTVAYDRAGSVSQTEANERRARAAELRREIGS